MMTIEEVIYMMLVDDKLVVNTRTLKETELFVDICKGVLMEEGLIEIDQEDVYDLITGNTCYSIYGPETCFTLELEILEHADKKYFEEDFKDYNIVTLNELL